MDRHSLDTFNALQQGARRLSLLFNSEEDRNESAMNIVELLSFGLRVFFTLRVTDAREDPMELFALQ